MKITNNNENNLLDVTTEKKNSHSFNRKEIDKIAKAVQSSNAKRSIATRH